MPNGSDALFQVFDGHGGRGTVDFVSYALPRNIAHFLRVAKGEGADTARALKAAFLLTDIQVGWW